MANTVCFRNNVLDYFSEMIKSHDILPTPIASGIEIAPGWGILKFNMKGKKGNIR